MGLSDRAVGADELDSGDVVDRTGNGVADGATGGIDDATAGMLSSAVNVTTTS